MWAGCRHAVARATPGLHTVRVVLEGLITKLVTAVAVTALELVVVQLVRTLFARLSPATA